MPASELLCLPDPEIPDGSIGDDELGQYLISVWQAGDDCRRKLSSVARTLADGPAAGGK